VDVCFLGFKKGSALKAGRVRSQLNVKLLYTFQTNQENNWEFSAESR